MKKMMYRGIAAIIVSLASLFVLTGSYYFIYKPEIPAELRK
ncbi:cyclic lactone autoinducer peptide [Paenibacillus albus]|uniref:Cyclic lactone autoinducer peptide n=1 Tax=Paenibacillus albus TaxID=2495582 RepID=A0A3Q8X856_9BACL|nr:cyclic lactone autoinducer peptide [Paenibacillus albus]AZN42543.1 cyclic lactone autoinducer peptide [Paenibacillus albus]